MRKRKSVLFEALSVSSTLGSHREFSHVNLHTHPLFWLLIGRELLASDWARGCHRNGKPLTIELVGSRGSHMTGSDVMGTGSHVF